MLGSILTVKKRSERRIPYCHVNLHKAPTGRDTKTCLLLVYRSSKSQNSTQNMKHFYKKNLQIIFIYLNLPN